MNPFVQMLLQLKYGDPEERERKRREEQVRLAQIAQAQQMQQQKAANSPLTQANSAMGAIRSRQQMLGQIE